MAANYWESTQRKYWQFTKDQLQAMRQKLEDEEPSMSVHFPLPPVRHLNIFFNQQLSRISKRLQVRQQAVATAQVYIKRFYCNVDIRRTNPYTILTTALYLACKMEECPQHIRLVSTEARALFPEFAAAVEAPKLGEAEFYLISEMNSQLIVHQPYRTLLMLHSELSLSQDELGLAWSCINDHYMTDLPLLHAPHTIAVTALVLTLVVLPSRAVAASAAAQQAAAFAAAQQQSQSQQSHSHHLGHHHHAAGTANNNQHANLAAVAANGAMGGAGATATSLAGSAVVGGLSAAQVMTALAHVTSTGTAQQQQPRDGQQVGTPSQSSTALAARSKMGQFALWLAESNVDLEAVVDCCQEMVSFYECYDQYNEKLTREQIHRYIKARGLDK